MAGIKDNFIYLVCDYATTTILLTTKDMELATSLSAGILNSYVKTFSPENTNPTILLLLNNVAKHYYLKDPNVIDEMMESSVTPDLINKKKLIQRRSNLMAHWVRLCKTTYRQQKIFLDPVITALLDTELSKCVDEPTNLIHELASIMEVDVDTYMDDMRLKLDSVRNMKLRISTVFDKYRNKLNSLKQTEELRQAYRDGVKELISNAHI